MIRVGVIGYGYWGPNIVRNLNSLGCAKVVTVCDRRESALARAKQAYPGVTVTQDEAEVLNSPEIDAVAVITPVWTHYDLAEQALNNGKHVFVEKPFTSTAEQGERLVELAERKGLTIMVDHTFLFTGAVRKIKQLVDEDALGQLYYYDSMRVNLGLFQHDVNVLWDLAPHDLAIMDYVIGMEAEAVVATGAGHLNGHADVAFMTIYFPNNVIAHLNVNWLSPVKVRTTLLGGEKKMLVWNDLEADEKLKIYDRGVKLQTTENVYEALVSYRSGDMWSPKVEATEALKLELGYFAECIEKGERPFNDGLAGLRVVKMLEAAEGSLKRRGEVVYA
ncbi:MAG: Gfo/Idh/MocA family oxidoreductase [Bryobacteraceae bacterium]|nr:Gfo/Idh/MocA family oxidoreductase [Bryobacteraceae bacterium]